MTSEAKTLANRRNAQKSTGPRTPQGKALASLPVSPRHCRGFFLPEQKNVFYQTNPNLLDRTKITNPFFLQRFTKPRLHFRYQENEPKLPEKKTFFTKRTQIFLVDKDHKSCWCKGLRSQACILPIKKTNPNEPKLTRRKNFFYETNPNLIGAQSSQTLLLQRFTKASPHFPYQENEPKRTQAARIENLFLRNEPKSYWYPKLTTPFFTKVYEANAAFSLSRKRTQTNPNSPILI
ncbi:MAG: hypothetical protein ACYTEX_21390 [Planctomycetota bacterium]|jgi:hypothetical protein